MTEQHYTELKQLIAVLGRTVKAQEALTSDDAPNLVEVVTDYAYALDTLDRYDYQQLAVEQTTNEAKFHATYEGAMQAIAELKEKFGGSQWFAHEKDDSFKSSIGQIYQTFDGKDLYPSVEEKAAMLLYLVTKNHSFSDGNKRIAATLFLWFMAGNGILYNPDGSKRIADNTLVALTLMIAESRTEEKDIMVKVVGDYIHEVDVRNRDLEVNELVGLTINKAFIPSVANTIGTDLSNYKVIRKDQFACSLMQVSRDGKMPVAMFEGECAIMSPAYPMFEVVDKTVLLPQYLMMWFSRNEFDREASFYAVGGVRGSLTWQDFCDMTLPIPPIEQQRKIVAEYETISKRIRLNEQMITRLEETAQTLYRKMFVDGIDKENLPEGWRMGTLGEVADFAYGKMPDKSSQGNIPIFSGYGIVGYSNIAMFEKQHIIVIARGDTGSGKIVLSPNVFYLTNLAIAILLKDDRMKYYLYYYLLNSDTSTLRSGSAQAQVTINSLYSYDIIIPSDNSYNEFSKLISPINEQKQILSDEDMKLTELQSLLLAKMGQYK